MITQERLADVLKELIGGEASGFSSYWILNSPYATEASIREVYSKLVSYDFSKSKIVSQAQLLSRDPDTIERNHANLSRIGLSNSKIVSQAQLLSRDPETIDTNYKHLQRIGLSNSKIVSQAQLLGKDPETIDTNYKHLQRIGLSNSKIATNAQLLSRDPETIERNYINAVSLLRKVSREDYEGRVNLKRTRDRINPEREKIAKYAWMLSVSGEILEANIQYLNGKVDYNRQHLILETTPRKKREKLAFLLREVFDYRQAGSPERKRELVDAVYRMVNANPHLLVDSVKTLGGKKAKLRKRAGEWLTVNSLIGNLG